MSLLILAAPVTPAGEWHWAYFDGDAMQRAGTAKTEVEMQALSNRGAQDCTLIVPGQQVRIYDHDLPTARRSDAVKAAQFFIEDKLAGIASEMHIILGSGEDKRIAVIEAGYLDTLLTELRRVGLSPSRIVADFDLARDMDDMALRLPDRLIVPGPSGLSVDAGWESEIAQGRTISDIDYTDLLQAAVKPASDPPSLNIRQGTFARKNSGAALSARTLAYAAGLALFAGLSFLAFKGAEAHALNKITEADRAEAARIYTDVTGRPAPANPALELRRAAGSQSVGSLPFLEMSSILSRAVEATPGMAVDSVQYDAARNQLQLSLIYPSFETATTFEQAVRNAGGVLQPGGVRETGDAYSGAAVLMAGGGS